jgi:hypothetical protein
MAALPGAAILRKLPGIIKQYGERACLDEQHKFPHQGQDRRNNRGYSVGVELSSKDTKSSPLDPRSTERTEETRGAMHPLAKPEN